MNLDSLRSHVTEPEAALFMVRKTAPSLSPFPGIRKLASFLVLAFLLVPLTTSQRRSHVPFHPPEGVLVAGLRETATHRSSILSLRITSDHAPANANCWVWNWAIVLLFARPSAR